MTLIRPFRAVVYNPEKVGDLSGVVCPPYDIISPARQQYFHQRNPHNLIRVLFGFDVSGEDKYDRAEQLFKKWLEEKALIQDQGPAIYAYNQQYALKGEKRSRLGFICLLRLDDKNAGVFAHEHTRSEPKEDRLRLLRQVQANLSPIFVLFQDKKRVIRRMAHQHLHNTKPFIDIVDDEKIRHSLWRIDGLEAIERIQRDMDGVHLFIADGHHRYEVACMYRQEERRKCPGFTGEEGWNYIMAYFTNVEAREPTVLPIHRLVRLDPHATDAGLLFSLKEHFAVEEIKDKDRFFFLMQKGGRSEHVLGIYKDSKYLLLRLKNIRILDALIADKPKEYRTLDVSILNYLILKRTLGVDIEDKERIAFSQDADEFIRRVDADGSLAAFFLNPVKVEQIIAVALTGEKMPSKSTYFYPKVLSGLVINKHEA